MLCHGLGLRVPSGGGCKNTKNVIPQSVPLKSGCSLISRETLPESSQKKPKPLAVVFHSMNLKAREAFLTCIFSEHSC